MEISTDVVNEMNQCNEDKCSWANCVSDVCIECGNKLIGAEYGTEFCHDCIPYIVYQIGNHTVQTRNKAIALAKNEYGNVQIIVRENCSSEPIEILDRNGNPIK